MRYLSLHDNTYVRYFKGHKKQCVSRPPLPPSSLRRSVFTHCLRIGATGSSPFVCHHKMIRSSRARRTTRYGSGTCEHKTLTFVIVLSLPPSLPSPTPFTTDTRAFPQGLLNVAGTPCIAYDPSGAVFAVVLNLRSTVMLYDVTQFDKQPFLCVHIDDPVLRERSYPPRTPVYTSCEFSNDGKWLLVGTSGDTHYVLDSFDGTVVARLECAFSLFSLSFCSFVTSPSPSSPPFLPLVT